MNISRLLLIVGLALATNFLLHHFVIKRFFPAQEQTTQVAATFNREIDFIDVASLPPARITTVDTPGATYQFSTHGAAVEQITYKRALRGDAISINTIEKLDENEREKRAFLVALPQVTPYLYEFVGEYDRGDTVDVSYRARTPHATIEKTFVVFKNVHQLDLIINVTPREPLAVRLFYPAPIMPGHEDVVSAVMNTPKGSLQKIARASVDLQASWKPDVFGSENSFFIRALYRDTNHFANQAYYALSGHRELTSIIQSAQINKPTEWRISFYVGPKEGAALTAVDKRLEDLLEYSGWLAPASKVLLKALNWLYDYTHNYGWAIILLTLLINLILLPLTIKGMQGMKKRTEFQKKLNYLKQRHKDDPEGLRREQAELITKHGMPGLSGCLPNLLQLPIFFALSRLLTNSIQLYKAPFIFWIKDLSVYDPYYVLPGLITIAIIAQSAQADVKQRVMMMGLGLVFGALTSSFSAGLCIYILVGIAFRVVQMLVQKLFGWA